MLADIVKNVEGAAEVTSGCRQLKLMNGTRGGAILYDQRLGKP